MYNIIRLRDGYKRVLVSIHVITLKTQIETCTIKPKCVNYIVFETALSTEYTDVHILIYCRKVECWRVDMEEKQNASENVWKREYSRG